MAVGGQNNNTFEYGQGDGAAIITPGSLGIVEFARG
jgi:hypothetical protein